MSKEDIIEVAATVDKFIRFNKKRLANHELVRDIISPILLSLNSSTPLLPKRLKKALESLGRNKSIKIKPADKCGRIAVIDVGAYKQKAMGLHNDNETYERLVSNPLDS